MVEIKRIMMRAAIYTEQCLWEITDNSERILSADEDDVIFAEDMESLITELEIRHPVDIGFSRVEKSCHNKAVIRETPIAQTNNLTDILAAAHKYQQISVSASSIGIRLSSDNNLYPIGEDFVYASYNRLLIYDPKRNKKIKRSRISRAKTRVRQGNIKIDELRWLYDAFERPIMDIFKMSLNIKIYTPRSKDELVVAIVELKGIADKLSIDKTKASIAAKTLKQFVPALKANERPNWQKLGGIIEELVK